MHNNGSQPLQSHAILSIETIDTVVDLKKKGAPACDRQKQDGAIQPTMLHRERNAGLKRTNKYSSTYKNYSGSRKIKKRSMALDAVLFFVTTFFLSKEKDGSKVDADVGRAFLRKRSRRSSAIFGSFF